MTFFHIVSFKVNDKSTLPDLTKSLLAIKDSCARDGRQYIKSVKGGKQVSNEGKDHEMHVTFIMEFESDEDLQYYLWKCPTHAAFKDSLSGGKVAGVIALDFEDGVY